MVKLVPVNMAVPPEGAVYHSNVAPPGAVTVRVAVEPEQIVALATVGAGTLESTVTCTGFLALRQLSVEIACT